MFKCDELLSLLGLSVSDYRLTEYFSRWGIDVASEVLLEEGEFTAYLERKSDGVSLVFTDEAMFLRHEQQPLGTGPLYLSGFFLYSEGKDGFTKFAGQLPKLLDFADPQPNVQEKLGRNADFRFLDDDGLAGRERWDEENFSIGVDYLGADRGIDILCVFRPRVGQKLPVGTR